MKKITVKSVNNIDEIKKVLDLFSNSLKSLSQGETFKTQMAKKFATNGNVFVIGDEEKTYGFCACYMNDVENKVAFISMFATLPTYRGSGIGSQMMQFVAKSANQSGMQKIRLQVDKENYIALNFYRKNNFEIVKENVDSYYMEYELME